ncbi:MAG: hypothetical protein M3410_04415 [Acidobacteriota bacterium]|nr:hypothetical protein [Acidobacteriota bacterium]
MFDNRGRLLILATILAAGILGVLAWAADITTGADNSPTSPSTTQGANPQQVMRDPRSVHVVRFALYDAGILPHEARVASGRVVISITDFTGGTDGIVVQRETDRTDVGQVRRDGARWRGRRELNLSPGTYHLYDASRRENRATLIVEP